MYFIFPSRFHYFIYNHFYYLSLFCNIWASVFSFKTIEDRSSRPEMFCKKGVPRNFAKFAGSHLYQRLFFNKVAGLGRFPLNVAKFLRTPFFTEHLPWLLLSHHFPSKYRDSVFIIFFIIQVKIKPFAIPSNFSSDIASTLMMISCVADTILTSQFRTFWSNNQSQAWKTQNNAKCPKLAATRFSNLWCNEELAGVFFSGSGSRSKIRHIAQGWPLFNIFNQIVKVKVEIRECFLIQYFFSTARTLYFSVFLQLSLNCNVKMVSVKGLITIKMLKNQGKGHK